MGKEILDIVLSNVFDIVIAVLALVVGRYLIPLIKTELKPWLEEKRIYNLVRKFVEAAEKLSETGVIQKVDKKDYVLKLLTENGVPLNPTIEAFVESAVKQLDMVVDTAKEEVLKESE